MSLMNVLVAIRSFGAHVKGDVIADAAKIAAIPAEVRSHFVAAIHDIEVVGEKAIAAAEAEVAKAEADLKAAEAAVVTAVAPAATPAPPVAAHS